MNKIITIIIFITVINFIVPPIFAADSTPSADVTTKLKALQVQIASQAAKIKQDINKKLQNKVFAGTIKSKSDNSLTLATKTGTRMVSLNDYTDYDGKGKVALKSLTADDYVIALGDIDETEVLTAKKVIKTASPSAEERKIVFGQVTSTSDQTVTIQRDGQNTSISVDKDTDYSFGKNPGSFDEIKAGKPIVAIGQTSQGNILQARFIYIFPYTANIKPKIASPSASTSSAKKK